MLAWHLPIEAVHSRLPQIQRLAHCTVQSTSRRQDLFRTFSAAVYPASAYYLVTLQRVSVLSTISLREPAPRIVAMVSLLRWHYWAPESKHRGNPCCWNSESALEATGNLPKGLGPRCSTRPRTSFASSNLHNNLKCQCC